MIIAAARPSRRTGPSQVTATGCGSVSRRIDGWRADAPNRMYDAEVEEVERAAADVRARRATGSRRSGRRRAGRRGSRRACRKDGDRAPGCRQQAHRDADQQQVADRVGQADRRATAGRGRCRPPAARIRKVHDRTAAAVVRMAASSRPPRSPSPRRRRISSSRPSADERIAGQVEDVGHRRERAPRRSPRTSSRAGRRRRTRPGRSPSGSRAAAVRVGSATRRSDQRPRRPRRRRRRRRGSGPGCRSRARRAATISDRADRQVGQGEGGREA